MPLYSKQYKFLKDLSMFKSDMLRLRRFMCVVKACEEYFVNDIPLIIFK